MLWMKLVSLIVATVSTFCVFMCVCFIIEDILTHIIVLNVCVVIIWFKTVLSLIMCVKIIDFICSFYFIYNQDFYLLHLTTDRLYWFIIDSKKSTSCPLPLSKIKNKMLFHFKKKITLKFRSHRLILYTEFKFIQLVLYCKELVWFWYVKYIDYLDLCFCWIGYYLHMTEKYYMYFMILIFF